MITIIIRTILIYISVAVFIRLTGKRQIGELQLSELVTTLLLSELAAAPIADSGIPLSHALLPISVLITLEIIVSFVITKSRMIKRFIEGMPSYLIRRGELDIQELAKQRISVEELLSTLRQKDIASPADAEYAILEQNGQLSVFPKNAQGGGIAHPVIIDGNISDCNLSLAGHDRAWLSRRLSELGCGAEDVFLFTVDDSGGEFFVRKQTK